MFGFGLVGLMLAFSALALLGGGDDDDYAYPDPDTPRDPDDDDDIPGQGGPGDDLITARDDVSVYNGLGGNDTLIGFPEFGVELNGGVDDDLLIALEDDHAFGGEGNDLLIGEHMDPGRTEQILRGGGGNDTLVSAGGSEMTGGAGDDVFVVAPGGLDATGAPQAFGGDPLSVPLIRDFDPAHDRLVIDLERDYTAPFDDMLGGQFGPEGRDPMYFGDTVSLTAARGADGTGVVIFVDGIAMAELEGFDDMDPAAVLAAITIDVNGAEVQDADTGDVTGLTIDEDELGNVTLALSDAFEGGGNFGGGDAISTLDLSALTQDMRVTVSETGVITVQPVDGSWPAATFEEIEHVILGSGDDLFDGSAGSGQVTVAAGSGTDTILGSNRTDVGDILTGAGYLQVENGVESWEGVGPSLLVGGAGDDTLVGGLGDSLEGGAGVDKFDVWGYGAEGAGPTVITDFNPREDVLRYYWVDPIDADRVHDIEIRDSDDGLLIIDDGRVVVVVPGLTLADSPYIVAGDRSVSLPI